MNVGVTEMRCRSMFYTSLGRLLMVDLGEDEDKFDAFMIPLTTAFESLGRVMATGVYNSEEVRKFLPFSFSFSLMNLSVAYLFPFP